VLRAASRFEAYLVDLNQIQLESGLNIRGEVIGTYSAATEQIADREGTVEPKNAGSAYNFQWTGELFAGMFVTFTSEYIEIFSRAPHAELVREKYSTLFGENVIFGLTQESLIEFVELKLLPEIRKYVCQTLNIAA